MSEVLVCSHRGPWTFSSVDGAVRVERGSGGLVTALAPLLGEGGADVVWLACALSNLERSIARREVEPPAGTAGLCLLDVPEDTHRLFYDLACVTGLGFLFHELVDVAHTPTFDRRFHQAWSAYRVVNRLYARAAVDKARMGPIMVEDYHLMLVADEIRRLHPRSLPPLVYFHHVPWCSKAGFSRLPAWLQQEILGKMLSFDSLGFHAHAWANAFLECVDAFLPGAKCGERLVQWDGREATIVVAPAQIDVEEVDRCHRSERAAQWRQRLQQTIDGRPTLVRVDRVDLWKNIIRGFQAFEAFVLSEGDWAKEVTFVAQLAPSRLHLPQYREYLAACLREAERVNGVLRTASQSASIYVSVESDRARALAALGLADVVLVNSTSDGLNLVAKESVAVSERSARLVLSSRTGVFEELRKWTLGVNPFDVEETARSIGRAFRPGKRWASDAARLRAAVTSVSPHEWVDRRLAGVSYDR